MCYTIRMLAKHDQPHRIRFLAGILAAILLTGCAAGSQSTEALRSYRTEMEGLFSDLENVQSTIDGIDASADNADELLVQAIDEMSAACSKAAAAEAPAGYEVVQERAEHAAAMMGQASSEFHTAFEAETMDQDAYDAAMEYYKSACSDIQSMISGLQNSFN